MKISLQFLCAFLLFTACNKTNQGSFIAKKAPIATMSETKTNGSKNEAQHLVVDKIHIGTTIDEMKNNYKYAEFKLESVYEYGVDGEGMGIVVIEKGERQFFVWTLEGQEKIHGITILSPSIK